MIYNKKDFKNLIKLAFKKALESKREVFFSYTFKLKENFDRLKFNILNENEFFYFSLPENENQFIGLENINKSNTKDFNFNSYLIISNTNKNKLLAFKISAFDINRTIDAPWIGISRNISIVPKILLQKNNNITINQIIKYDMNEKLLITKIDKQINYLLKNNKYQPIQLKFHQKETIPSKKNYLDIIQNTINNLDKFKLKKIVLSKIEKYKIDSNLDTHSIVKNMDKKYGNCFNYFIKINNEDSFFGSSPEILLKKDGLNLSSMALAGTSSKKDNLNNIKEIEEQKFVSDYIKSILKKYCKTVRVSGKNIFKMNYAYHLQSTISGIMLKNYSILKIIKDLYPTPALSGYPQKESINKIKSIEQFDRGYYGGLIGLYNLNKDGIFFVPIRCALKRKNEIYFFTGGGITNKSECLKEWEETEIKLNHIKSITDLK